MEQCSPPPLNILELCRDEGYVDDPENRIWRGKFKANVTRLETALVMTPMRDEEDNIVVFYLWGAQPKWDIDEAGCSRTTGTEKGNTLTLRLSGGKRVIYKFSGEKASAKYKSGGHTTKGKLTLSEM